MFGNHLGLVIKHKPKVYDSLLAILNIDFTTKTSGNKMNILCI